MLLLQELIEPLDRTYEAFSQKQILKMI